MCQTIKHRFAAITGNPNDRVRYPRITRDSCSLSLSRAHSGNPMLEVIGIGIKKTEKENQNSSIFSARSQLLMVLHGISWKEIRMLFQTDSSKVFLILRKLCRNDAFL